MQELRPKSRKTDPSGARGTLRTSTDVVHRRLHGASAFRDIADGRLDRRGYADLLARLLVFHRAVDPLLAGARSLLGYGPAGSARLGRLESDYRYLGGGSVPTLDAPAACDGRAVGCLYVVEGSMLGGKLIHRQLDYLFAANEDGRRFFAGADDDSARWRDLCGRLDAYGAIPGRLPAMIAGAAAAFELFETCLEARV